MLSLFLVMSDNSWDQLMLFVLLYPTLNKSYVMLCRVVSCRVVPYRVVSYRIVSCRVVSCYGSGAGIFRENYFYTATLVLCVHRYSVVTISPCRINRTLYCMSLVMV